MIEEVWPVRLLQPKPRRPTSPSVRARLLVALFRATREKHTWTHPRRLDREIRRSQRPANAEAPRWLRRRYDVERFEVHGHPCYTIRPRAGGAALHAVHLHGGAYVQQIEPHHWRFVARLIDRTGCAVTVPLYPLAPAHHVDETVAMVRAVYDRVLGQVDPTARVLMGDSAGGGLALVLAQQLRDDEAAQPARIVLISPWLDVTMSDPTIPELDRRDPYLGASGLADAGRRYAGQHDTRDPQVSPLYGDLAGIGPVATFIGTRDVLLSDARRLHRAMTEAGTPLTLHEYPGMVHNWPMRRLPEAHAAMAQIVEYVTTPSAANTQPTGKPMTATDLN
jgi:monoterpene epsilon-lactone hydrolase